jgi:hypothetical protein
VESNPAGGAEREDYLSYLLRLWQASDQGRPVWRASLKSSHTEELIGFGSLEELFLFLRRQTGTLPPADRNGQRP